MAPAIMAARNKIGRHVGRVSRAPPATSQSKFLARSNKSCGHGKATNTGTVPKTWADDGASMREPKTERGQQLWRTVALPDNTRRLFSLPMLAALAVVRDLADEGGCSAANVRIAYVAGVSISTVRTAIERARIVGLIDIGHASPGGSRVIINKGIGRMTR